jgi:peptide/nickel transport system substrate-binding protein
VVDVGQRNVLSAHNLYDRLVSTRIDKDYVLEAADSVELPDPTTVIFKLKPGLTYQDVAPVNGRPVVGEDIVQTQQYVRDNPRAGNNSFQRNSMQSADAPDDRTVVFKLKAPNAYLFSSTQLSEASGHCIMPREMLGNLEAGWTVGSGPYQMTEYELGVRYLYKRFDRYHQASKGLPYIEEREFRVYSDTAAQEAAFRSEQIHIWQLPVATLVDPLQKDMGAKIEMDEYLALAMQTWTANATKPPWNDVRVREAMYRVINRQQYLDLIQQGKGKVPPGPMNAGLTDYLLDPKQTEKYFRQDAREAKRLLDAAGFPYDREVEVSTINQLGNTQGCEILQQQVAPLGVKTRIVPMPGAEWLQQRIATGNWEVFVAYWPGYDTPQVPLRLHHTQTQHIHRYAGLKDPEVDRMIEKSEVTLDRDERIKQVKEIQLALLERYTPHIWLHNSTTYQARWKFVRDYQVNPATSQVMYRTEMWLDK